MSLLMESSLGVAPDATISRLHKLRTELKQWEKSFAATNEGRKAEREDIKKEPRIAQKYKDYNHLRKETAQKESFVQTSSSPSSASRKRKRNQQVKEGDRRTRDKVATVHPADIDPYDAPTHLTPTATRTFVNPTPQKNGQVLGLFDLLTPSTGKRTPTKSSAISLNLRDVDATPSKARSHSTPIHPIATPTKASSTPLSLSKNPSTNIFSTPQPRRIGTPSSRKNRNDETPDFLRRDNARFRTSHKLQAEESDEETRGPPDYSPVAVRMPPRPAGKGLSALVKSLQNMEEERLDEELEMLQEMENEAEEPIPKATMSQPQVRDSQAQASIELPLGADGDGTGSEADDVTGEGLTRDGRPLRVWKKRGQKRTTRKVNIKPSTVKWKPETAWDPHKDQAHEVEEGFLDSEGNEVAVAEAAAAGSKIKPGKRQSDEGESHSKVNRTKKISATAHANFRALKIKKKGNKFKGSGRFGRR